LRSVFERFTPAARTAVAEAQAEARELRHNHVGVEHLLLGVLREHDSAGAEALRSRGVSLERVRERVLEIVGPGDGDMPPGTHAPFTPRAKKVLELSLREALSHGSMAVDTEHLVLGIARESESIAMRVLTEEWGLSEQTLRELFPAPAPDVATVRRPVPAVDRSARVERSFGIRIDQSPTVRRLLMAASALALDDGRTEIEIDDLWVALTREPTAQRVAVELGIDERAVRDAISRQRGWQDPPEASASG
jgi:ATP-dependent Clp protease ATP-binding subunit ClpA